MQESCFGENHNHRSKQSLTIQYVPVDQLKANPRNPRVHSKRQLNQIAASIRDFGFNVPVLVDAELQIVAGHGRAEASRLINLAEIPTIRIDHLSPEQVRAFLIADNRITENSEWNESLLAEELKTLSELNLDFSLEVCGFETAEIDVLIEGLEVATAGPDPADQLPDTDRSPVVTQLGDLWLLNHHRLLCADARQEASFEVLMDENRASVVFVDPPYNVKIDGHASGKGVIKHDDFIMGSGENGCNPVYEFPDQRPKTTSE